MNPEIISYLKGAEPDFGQGFALFCKYSRNEAAMSWIGRRHDIPKLLYELQKLSKEVPRLNPVSAANEARFNRIQVSEVKMEPEAKATQQEPMKAVIRTYDDRRTRRSDLPPELQAVFDRNAEDYKLRRGFHEKMKLATTDKDRAEFRARIMDTDARIRAGWKEIDSFFESQAREKSELAFNESTCRSFISKALKREHNSTKQIATCRARVKALQEHGCIISDEILKQLDQKGLI